MKSNTATNKAVSSAEMKLQQAERKIQKQAEHIENELIRINYNLADVSNECFVIKHMVWIFFAGVIILMISLKL